MSQRTIPLPKFYIFYKKKVLLVEQLEKIPTNVAIGFYYNMQIVTFWVLRRLLAET